MKRKLDMRTCGIDPGLNGGITILEGGTGRIVSSITMPTIKVGKKERLDLAAIASFLSTQAPSYIAIELVGAMPGQGVTSMFSFGYGAGAIEGILAALKLPYSLVRPQTWMKAVLSWLPKSGSKSSVIWCQRMYPHVDWRATERCKKAHDGKTDSACLAWYALKNF